MRVVQDGVLRRVRASKTLQPSPHSDWIDSLGRILTVSAVDPLDPQGREVQGAIWDKRLGKQVPYSCTLAHWVAVWRDDVPVVEVKQ